MKPVVVNPDITIEQLFDGLAQFGRMTSTVRRSANRSSSSCAAASRAFTKIARARYEAAAVETPKASPKRLTEQPTATVAAWAKRRPNLGKILDWEPEKNGPVLVPSPTTRI